MSSRRPAAAASLVAALALAVPVGARASERAPSAPPWQLVHGRAPLHAHPGHPWAHRPFLRAPGAWSWDVRQRHLHPGHGRPFLHTHPHLHGHPGRPFGHSPFVYGRGWPHARGGHPGGFGAGGGLVIIIR